MPQELVPLFPLAVVLFPRTRLPLHIFEDRYKEMVGEAIRSNSEFGIVLAGDQGIARSGCTAVVQEVTHRYPDGRLDIQIMGLRRFDILDLNNEKEYLRGEVRYFNDEETDPPPSGLREQAAAGFRELRALNGEFELPEPDWEDPQLSFQLAQTVPDLEFRQSLLLSRSEAERIRMLAEFFPRHLSQQRHIAHVRAVAPRNGKGPRVALS
jgi:Lon protease-like protein